MSISIELHLDIMLVDGQYSLIIKCLKALHARTIKTLKTLVVDLRNSWIRSSFLTNMDGSLRNKTCYLKVQVFHHVQPVSCRVLPFKNLHKKNQENTTPTQKNHASNHHITSVHPPNPQPQKAIMTLAIKKPTSC